MADWGNRKYTPRYRRPKEADEAESWRSPLGRDGERGYSPKAKRAHGRTSERARASLSCSSPEGRGFGPSPSHKERIQRGSPADRRNWREQPRDGPKHDRLGSVQSWREKSRVVRIERCLTKRDVLQLCSEAEGSDCDLKESSVNLKFRCDKCKVYCDDVSPALSHIRERAHRKKAKELQKLTLLLNIPPPGRDQCLSLSSALGSVAAEFGLNAQDLKQRRNILALVEGVLRPVLPDCQFRLYGSSCTQFGFRDSDVNIDVKFPSHLQHPDVLLVAQEHLSQSALFVSVEGDFHRRMPVVVCKEKSSGLICKVSAGNESACLTTAYLAELASLEPQLVPLVVCFRYWAKICCVDQMEEGGLPSYCFALMVISFLQRCKEPVLPSYLESVGLPLSKLKSFSLTGVEKGHVLWVYDQTSSDSSQEKAVNKGKCPLVFKGHSPSVLLGELWIQLLRYYSLEFQIPEKVISVRTNGDLWRDLKDWPKKRIAIEDPFAVQRNVARMLNSQMMFEYLVHCLKTTYKYFASPWKSAAGKVSSSGQSGRSVRATNHVDSVKRSPRVSAEDLKRSRARSSPQSAEELEDSDCVIELELEPDEEEADSELETEGEDDEDVELDGSGCDQSGDEIFPFEREMSDDGGSDAAHPEEAVSVLNKPKAELTKSESPQTAPEGFQYIFSKRFFSNGKPPVLICSLCKSDGHLKQDCPEDFKRVELDPLPLMTLDFLQILDEVCEQCYRDFAPDDVEVQVREHILQDFETFLRCQVPGAKLVLFGSSKNGFGFKQSDLDICMTLEGQDTAEGLDSMAVIESLTKALRKHHSLRNILPITTAKVPIVKFYHTKTGLEGDISLYNTLALHNTQLLASYAAIDARVKILCYVMKVFAKICDIGDASRGSLSSYAYTLMVLYFLQQRSPPVIPVLQEMYVGEKKPVVLVEGWDVHFFSDLKNLHKYWPGYKMNEESVGQLWFGLLQFYTETFDFRETVVCIRRKEPLTTFKKQWTSKHLAIEDPFDLSHNLGAGLSRRMASFIMKAFINARRVFGTPLRDFPPEYPNKMEYFFDPEVLTEGKLAPNDRCCRVCGKIGHFMKDCPMRRRQRRDPDGRDVSRADGRALTDGGRWRQREEKCCYLCGSSAHIKKDCLLAKSLESSPNTHQRSPACDRDRLDGPQQDRNKNRKARRRILGPEAGSVASRHASLNASVEKWSPFK
ncbi:terminal uridylyltransferase 7 [Carassius gibelio]|uniref:terminal uridylyltransferase 7 n=1 Tax=Carassius gibelio TaxID=101364 RepID=UPI00227984C2|nr:terminal uridylyltransferase 7 [Carassius gibelio]XP_052447417.1 terminal uridylyltransferase 7 [Carassius gibelio]XP_052447418.1 terminal uridylyltransferase 7 [Carassius gibelio]XP_052447419.1 terminal uridylyltransferase 7 [Carassius gibelio]XP_052447420.1 terminal uridylyltransferase 7 [Carassius gibelio]